MKEKKNTKQILGQKSQYSVISIALLALLRVHDL